MQHPEVAPDIRRLVPSATGDDAGPFGVIRSVEATPSGTSWRPADFEAVKECLALLGRALRQFQTYPAISPFCTDAIGAVHEALRALTGREWLAFRVGPTYLLLDDVATITGPAIEQDLARRLHRVQVAAVEIARVTTAAELTRFCTELSALRETPRGGATFAAWWSEQRIDNIGVRAAHRPVVIEAGTPSAVAQRLVAREQRRRNERLAQSGPVHHLYAPDKGWVLIDPSMSFDSVSLADLALLLDDPAAIAIAMIRLSDEQRADAIEPQTAFVEKFSELASLFASVDPQLSQMLLSKLARSLLDLDETRRTTLLRQTVLPGLLDATMDGAMLASFPDVDLADALCLLLDLEAAAPEVLATAVEKLGLSDERREALEPLLAARLDGAAAASPNHATNRSHDVVIDRFARKLIAVDASQARRFSEYAAFDLSVTAQTRATVAQLADDITGTDGTVSLLETIGQLLRIEADATAIARYAHQATPLLAALAQQRRWAVVAHWGGQLRAIGAHRRPANPAAADAITAELRAFWTAHRLGALATLVEGDAESTAVADALVDGFGPELAAVVIAALDDQATADRAFALLPLLGDHAALVAPMLAQRLSTARGSTRLAIIRLLGQAGPTYGAKVAALLATGDEETVNEALQALVRIGSSAAATAVARQVLTGSASVQAAAEALLRFPPAQATPRVRELLATRGFVVRHPAIASQLLDFAGPTNAAALGRTLQDLTALRFRFWNPALVRVARQAATLLSA
jgi:hypothetical protein